MAKTSTLTSYDRLQAYRTRRRAIADNGMRGSNQMSQAVASHINATASNQVETVQRSVQTRVQAMAKATLSRFNKLV